MESWKKNGMLKVKTILEIHGFFATSKNIIK